MNLQYNQITFSNLQRQILRQIHNYPNGDNAILAGGALRDQALGVPPSDFDIFIKRPTTVQEQKGLFANLFTCQALKQVNTTFSVTCSYYTSYGTGSTNQNQIDNGIVSIIEGLSFAGDKIQIITVDTDPVEYVHRNFPIGLSKIYFDGTKVRVLKEFIADAKNDQITYFYHPDTDPRHHRRIINYYIPKIQAKYPTFTVRTVTV